MKINVSSTEAARNLGDILARIKHTGDCYVLTKNNKPVAELGPVPGAAHATLGRLWDALHEVSVDDDFARDLERVSRSDSAMENPWP